MLIKFVYQNILQYIQCSLVCAAKRFEEKMAIVYYEDALATNKHLLSQQQPKILCSTDF